MWKSLAMMEQKDNKSNHLNKPNSHLKRLMLKVILYQVTK